MLAEDEYFSMRSTNGKVFKLSKGQQEAILVSWIIEKRVQNFNSMELGEIIEYARMLSEREYLKNSNAQGVRNETGDSKKEN